MMQRQYKIKIYVDDSPTPLFYDNVSNLFTEGGLLRIIVNGKSQWFPLIKVVRIEEIERKEE